MTITDEADGDEADQRDHFPGHWKTTYASIFWIKWMSLQCIETEKLKMRF